MKQITFPSSDDLEIFGHISFPTTPPLASIVLVSGGIHGGVKFESGSYDPLHTQITDFLNQAGLVTLLVDKRGSKGYGEEYKQKLDFCGKEVDDVIAGAEHLKHVYGLDSARMFLHGTSRGATLAAIALTRTSLFRAGILASGFYEIKRQYEYDLRHRPEIFPTKQVLDGRHIDNFPYETHSPIKLADKIKCPILLVHGEDDQIVPINQTEEYYETLRKAGKEVELIKYPNFAHMKKFSYPSNPIGKKYWEDCVLYMKKRLE